MQIKTDLKKVKNIAEILLMTALQKTKFSPIIVHHPFTSNGIVGVSIQGKNQVVNILENKENLLYWQTVLKNRIREARSVHEIYMLINKPYSLTFLNFVANQLSKEDFSTILASAWIRSENPNCDVNVNKKKLVSMFKQAEPNKLMSKIERQKLNRLNDVVTVYRGLTNHNAKNIKALSWTLDQNQAEWFAHRFDEAGVVYQARIDKRHILALFDGRNESEVVVDPKYLIDIVEVTNPDSACNPASFRHNM